VLALNVEKINTPGISRCCKNDLTECSKWSNVDVLSGNQQQCHVYLHVEDIRKRWGFWKLLYTQVPIARPLPVVLDGGTNVL
jgi:hypothetical protein